MNNELLTDDNFLLYCAKHYDNPSCHSTEEFLDDMKHIKYIKKLVTRYVENGELKERLILNHIIVLYNVFGDATTNMLFYKIDEKYWDVLVTFLIYLERMPESLPHYNIKTSDIPLDEKVINALRKI